MVAAHRMRRSNSVRQRSSHGCQRRAWENKYPRITVANAGALPPTRLPRDDGVRVLKRALGAASRRRRCNLKINRGQLYRELFFAITALSSNKQMAAVLRDRVCKNIFETYTRLKADGKLTLLSLSFGLEFPDFKDYFFEFPESLVRVDARQLRFFQVCRGTILVNSRLTASKQLGENSGL